MVTSARLVYNNLLPYKQCSRIHCECNPFTCSGGGNLTGKGDYSLEPGPVIGYYAARNFRRRSAVLTYKVVELNMVSEDVLEEVLNEWTAKGWRFDGMHFAMRESQKRPSMAFVVFTREEGK